MASSPGFQRIAACFDRLIEQPSQQWPELLEHADLSPQEAQELRHLLSAHQSNLAHDSIDAPLARSARRLAEVDTPPPRRIGPWEVLRELGSGGMGTVFLAERADGEYRQQVAIKLLRGFPTADGLRRLQQERQILAQLDHPHIAKLLDGGHTDEGQPYVVMEYVPGERLLDHIRLARPNLDQRLTLFDCIASAVEHAHQQLIVHRDLKPANILVRDDATPRLLDFGVAKLLDAGADAEQTFTRVWTEGYASPEQLQGKALGTASDIYSMGVLLSEMLCGRRRSPEEALDARFPAIAPGRELRWIIARASAERVADRYPTIEALRTDLQNFRAGLPIRAGAGGRWYRFGKFARRHWPGIAIAAAFVGGIFAFSWQLKLERDRAVEAELRATRNAENSDIQTRFLAGVLMGAGGKNERGETITGPQLLEQAERVLLEEVAHQRPEASIRTATAANASTVTEAFRLAGLFDKAEENARRALAWSSDEPVDIVAGRWRTLARILVSLKRRDEAQAACRAGLQLLPHPPLTDDQAQTGTQLRITMAQTFSDPKDERRALVDLRDYARRYMPMGNVMRGMAAMLWAHHLEKSGQLAGLVEARRDVLTEWGQDPHAYATDLGFQKLNLARALRLTGKYSEAEQWLRKTERDFHSVLGERVLPVRLDIAAQWVELHCDRNELPLAAQALQRYDDIRARLGSDPGFDHYWLHARVAALQAQPRQAITLLEGAGALVKFPAQQQRIDALLGEQRIRIDTQ
jgi:eukaryotic-like serine/threonine-protein kinase